MTVAQITFTQRVTNVLRTIAHKRRTGLLRIEHVRVQEVEKGEICFEGGKVVHARVGQQVVYAVFHIQPAAATKQVMSQMERQDRMIFILLDGKRTVRDLAKLLHRSELAVASVLARLLKNGYIEFAGSNNR